MYIEDDISTTLSICHRLRRKFRQTSYDSLTNHSTIQFTQITYFQRDHDFRDDNDPLRKPELGHSGQYFRQACSLPRRLDEKRFHAGREKKRWRDINRENTAAGNVSGFSNFPSKWKPSSLAVERAGWRKGGMGHRAGSSPSPDSGWTDFVESRFTFPLLTLFLRCPYLTRPAYLLALANLFSRDVHTFSDDGLTLDLSQVEATARQQRTKDDEGTQWSEISLTLQPFHYSNGRLNLRCIAQIPGIYTGQSELHLLSGMREPVPERGNYKNSISTCSIVP